MQLVPVIELSVFDFAAEDKTFPSGSRVDQPAEWRHLWFDVMKSAGLTGLEPLPGTDLVPIERIVDASMIRTIIAGELRVQGPWGDIDEVSPINGGYVWRHEGTQLLPGCCADLGNLNEIRDALRIKAGSWEMVWMGHPWVYARVNGGRLEISPPTEGNAPTDQPLLFDLEFADVELAIAAAERVATEFQARLEDAMKRDFGARATALSKALVALVTT